MQAAAFDRTAKAERRLVFQASTLSAAMLGDFSAALDVRELKARGTVGIGTFEGLGGELILLDGEAWNGHASGRALPLADDAPLSFAMAARFAPDADLGGKPLPIEGCASFADFARRLDETLTSPNRIAVLRTRCFAKRAVFRSVGDAQKPWQRLAAYAALQKVFSIENEWADLVGFRFPKHLAGVNMPGWHIHLITADRRTGGHLLDLEAERMAAERMTASGLELLFPEDELFDRLPLDADLAQETAAVEGADALKR